MLDLWRPPQGAGDPVGCVTSTYTFSPGLFDEQCLARFLEIESEPDREGLAFLLERESRLGSVFAGVLVDYTQAGVEHSLRWDVLPVRMRGAKQHAKLSLLAWRRHVRIIVASANLTDAGYRSNYEVAGVVECSAESGNREVLAAAIRFLRGLLRLVPAAGEPLPEVVRCEGFLAGVEKQVRIWAEVRRRGTVRRVLACTLPAGGPGVSGRSALAEALDACRGRGGSPHGAWIASPFFDTDEETSRVTAALCKTMARGRTRELCFCVPASGGAEKGAAPRLAAPKSLLLTPRSYQGSVAVQILPDVDPDKNRRPWHAKMLALLSDGYSALAVGSSNFTCAGMGVTERRNAEANLVTIVDRVSYGREVGELESVWPDMEDVQDPDGAEWLGARPEREEEEAALGPPLPAGFVSATYRAGDARHIVMRFDAAQLPSDWRVVACGRDELELVTATVWRERGSPSSLEMAWAPLQPPERFLVAWGEHEAFLPLNVEDGRRLPPPSQLETMTAEDMLLILAASDPSGAFRAWARQQRTESGYESDLDSAVPVDLDPLRRHDLQATYLHRIRRRARVLAQLRANLQRPVWGRQALEWRLRGLVGIEPLADRLVRECAQGNGSVEEGLLTLADFLIVLHEVDYQEGDGSLPKADFEEVFRPFLRGLTEKLVRETAGLRERVPGDVVGFWDRTVERCRK
ncbi:MAG: hypothetical protein FJ225_09155 [Lentisphaerae bacterium]|nr:hypothetical protein [Planctomycetota bacterium]MBM4143739.1 hypothetical protein [Lentisphaerota bacterium]